MVKVGVNVQGLVWWARTKVGVGAPEKVILASIPEWLVDHMLPVVKGLVATKSKHAA